MEPEYEDGISGIAYVIDEESFPDGYLAAEDMSETLITISSAVKKNGKNGRMLGVANGATVKKEKKEKKEKQRKLRGGSEISLVLVEQTLLTYVVKSWPVHVDNLITSLPVEI